MELTQHIKINHMKYILCFVSILALTLFSNSTYFFIILYRLYAPFLRTQFYLYVVLFSESKKELFNPINNTLF